MQSTILKFKEPTIGKETHKIFRKHGYDVFLVDKYNKAKNITEMEQIWRNSEEFQIIVHGGNYSPRFISHHMRSQ